MARIHRLRIRTLHQDNIIPAERQQFMAERARAAITRVDAGHLSMISQPDTVTEVIRDAAGQAL